jgi:hypothetical protein
MAAAESEDIDRRADQRGVGEPTSAGRDPGQSLRHLCDADLLLYARQTALSARLKCDGQVRQTKRSETSETAHEHHGATETSRVPEPRALQAVWGANQARDTVPVAGRGEHAHRKTPKMQASWIASDWRSLSRGAYAHNCGEFDARDAVSGVSGGSAGSSRAPAVPTSQRREFEMTTVAFWVRRHWSLIRFYATTTEGKNHDSMLDLSTLG